MKCVQPVTVDTREHSLRILVVKAHISWCWHSRGLKRIRHVHFPCVFSVSVSAYSHLSASASSVLCEAIVCIMCADLKQLEKEMRLCVSAHCCVSVLSTAISRGQVQAIPGCASQGSCQRAAEEEEEPGASQHQDTASYWGEDAMTDKQRTLS